MKDRSYLLLLVILAFFLMRKKTLEALPPPAEIGPVQEEPPATNTEIPVEFPVTNTDIPAEPPIEIPPHEETEEELRARLGPPDYSTSDGTGNEGWFVDPSDPKIKHPEFCGQDGPVFICTIAAFRK